MPGVQEKPRSPFARVSSYVRSRGLAATLYRLFRLFIFNREHVILYEKLMQGEIDRVSAKIPGVIRRATLDDLPALCALPNQHPAEEFRRWIETEQAVWVFEHEGRIVSYRVVTREKPRLGTAGKLVHLEPKDVFVVNGYTLPECRGQRVMAAMVSHCLVENGKAGYEREISMGRYDNEAARRSFGMAGAREMEEIVHTRLLGFTWNRTVRKGRRRYYDGRKTS